MGHGLRAGREREARVKPPSPPPGQKKKKKVPRKTKNGQMVWEEKKKKKNQSWAQQANRESERSLAERWRWRFALCESRQARKGGLTLGMQALHMKVVATKKAGGGGGGRRKRRRGRREKKGVLLLLYFVSVALLCLLAFFFFLSFLGYLCVHVCLFFHCYFSFLFWRFFSLLFGLVGSL